MYHFAIVALLGLAVWKVMGMLLGLVKIELDAAVRALITLGVGVVAALVLDYSVFVGWNISISNADTGTVFTGLIVGAFAYCWHYALGAVEAYGRRHRDEAREIESRKTFAA